MVLELPVGSAAWRWRGGNPRQATRGWMEIERTNCLPHAGVNGTLMTLKRPSANTTACLTIGESRQPRENRRGLNPKKFGVERETGLEPATPCLEGRYLLFHRSQGAKPLKSWDSRVSTLYSQNMAGASAFCRLTIPCHGAVLTILLIVPSATQLVFFLQSLTKSIRMHCWRRFIGIDISNKWLEHIVKSE